jgi:hypothetical protein
MLNEVLPRIYFTLTIPDAFARFAVATERNTEHLHPYSSMKTPLKKDKQLLAHSQKREPTKKTKGRDRQTERATPCPAAISFFLILITEERKRKSDKDSAGQEQLASKAWE